MLQVADLEEELGRVSERLTETEQEAMSQQVNIRRSVIPSISIFRSLTKTG